jgi:uncharacterized protein YbjT (DUF2867 family)
VSTSGVTALVGSTGLLGMEVLQLLRAMGPVRAAIRTDTEQRKRALIDSAEVEAVRVDLKEPASFDGLCHSVASLVITASAAMPRQEGDSIRTVDNEGLLALIGAAERAGVKRVVFVSFPSLDVDFALQRAKRRVERRLAESQMSFTILQPAYFSEVWLSKALGFDPGHGFARLFGSGEHPVSWISIQDVARFAAAAAVGGGRFDRKVLPLGGPDPLSALQVLDIFRELGGPEVAIERIPESALEAQLKTVTGDEAAETFAALGLAVARGLVIDSGPAVELLPGRLKTVRQYATETLNESKRKT